MKENNFSIDRKSIIATRRKIDFGNRFYPEIQRMDREELLKILFGLLKSPLKVELIDKEGYVKILYYQYIGHYLSIGDYTEDELLEKDVMEKIVEDIGEDFLKIVAQKVILVEKKDERFYLN